MADEQGFDAEPDQPGGDSLFDGLKAKRAKFEEREPLDLEVPGYGGELVAVYDSSLIEWEEVNALLRKVEKSNAKRAEVYAAADILARCCSDFKIRLGEKFERIGDAADDLDGEPVRYDENLAKAVGVADKIDPAHLVRSIVVAVFGNDFALVGHQNEVIRWLAEGKDESAEDF